jgi:enterochelin esterase-like enzyme
MRNANILLPADYNSNSKYPVLYLLHGIGGDENEWKNVNPQNIIANLVAEKAASKMIIVLPNVRARYNDGGNPPDIFSLGHFEAFDHFIDDLKNNLIPYINNHFSILEGREHTAIAGLSMGGRESLYIGITMPDTFGYIGAFSPAYGIFRYTNNHVTEQGLFQKEAFHIAESYHTVLLIMTGLQDEIVHHEPERYHQVLSENGTNHLFYTIKGGHDFDVWSKCLYAFLKMIFRA